MDKLSMGILNKNKKPPVWVVFNGCFEYNMLSAGYIAIGNELK
jgi:hypothetical protein